MKESPFLRRAMKPQRPAKNPLGRDQIVQAALRIVKTEGIDGVSMRRIAAEFDTGPSSLYAHVTNKDELLQLMFDEVCGMIDIPALDAPHWKDQVLWMARESHRILLEHYDLARAALATIPTGPNALRASDAMIGMMLAGGVPPQIAAWAMDRIFLYITADAYEMSIWRGAVTEAGTDRESFVDQLDTDLVAYFQQVPADLYPNIRKYAREMVSGDADARFELGLAMLIDGLDKYVTK
jgi:AcrR family transcriptional regulator